MLRLLRSLARSDCTFASASHAVEASVGAPRRQRPVAEAAHATHSSQTIRPNLIEIVPPTRRINATVVLPGSKSLTNRALILAALASNPVSLHGALWSEDTQAMVACLERLGFTIEVADDPREQG